MTARPIFPECRKSAARVVAVLCIVMMALLVAAGCINEPARNSQSGTIPSPAVPALTQKSSALYKVTIAQQNDSQSDLIHMDSDIYNQGEVVEFYLVNDRPEPLECVGDFSSYRIFSFINRSWSPLPQPPGTYVVVITGISTRSYLQSGTSTEKFHLITNDLTPGRYKIQFVCLNIYREFEIRKIPRVTP
jgi:hypothetical protein